MLLLTFVLLVSCVPPEKTSASSVQSSGDAKSSTPDSSGSSSQISAPSPPATWTAPALTVFIGNSLTSSTGEIGACASDSEHDYFYLVSQFLRKYNPGAQTHRMNFSIWEGKTTSRNRQACWNNIEADVDPAADLVIIQLADNVNTDAKKATFEKDGIQLVSNIRKRCPNAQILWVAAWYPAKGNMEAVANICDKTGAVLVDISDLGSVKENQGKIGMQRQGANGSAWLVKTKGEASHPGDVGMGIIATRIEQAIGTLTFKKV